MVTAPRLPHRGATSERGFTLVEVLVAALILLVGVLGVLTLLDASNRATSRTKARQTGTSLAREAIEAARAVPYPDLTPATFETELKAQPGLGDASGGTAGWNVVRGHTMYTLRATVCSVDDGTIAGDGYGDHAAGSFCADSNQTGTNDLNPDDYKRVGITATWQERSKTYSVRQEAVINNPGSAFAPAIKTLTPAPASPVKSPATGAVSFAATTNVEADTVMWRLDHLDQGTATATAAGGKNWAFSWNIASLVDGTYQVSAEAFDEYGQSGTGRTVTMVLNRYAPAAPTGLVGGHDPLWGAHRVEFEWTPNPERDIAGYRVYQVTGAAPSTADRLACATSISDARPTSCIDDAAPETGILHYYVVAVAPTHLAGTALEESARPALSGTLTVDPANHRPSAPGDISISQDPDGVRLTWSASTDLDGSVRFYRIYRDRATLAGRYDRTSDGTALTFVDAAGTDVRHRYWISAVDDHLAESELVPDAGVMLP